MFTGFRNRLNSLEPAYRRKLIALLILSALLTIATSALRSKERAVRPPKVAEKVTLGGTDVSRWEAGQLGDLLARWADATAREPKNAYLDPSTKGVIHELNGVRLDTEGTLKAVFSAPSGSTLLPVFEQVRPSRTLADFPLAPIYQGHPDRKRITLIINVSWGEEFIPEMLEILKEGGASATFFLTGRWVMKNPDVARKIVAAGHEAASHGHSDAHLQNAPEKKILEEIEQSAQAIEAATGRQIKWFSAPYGELSERILRVAAEKGLRVVMWTADTVDWKRPGVEWMVDRIMSRASNGSLVLMHPTEQTPQALRGIVKGLKEKGYRLVTLSEMLSPVWNPGEQPFPSTFPDK
ncbi:MAG: polysaccharide deacetylase family protein [Firmicutes bacterium]|nr:polysaccharide deacetylase family protein [Bacillota bacterium]